jgi:hypothetical protein
MFCNPVRHAPGYLPFAPVSTRARAA